MDAGVGWIAAIIIGGIAGWLAEQFMKSNMGLLMNIVLGIVGAAIASAILRAFGIALGGWLGYLIPAGIGNTASLRTDSWPVQDATAQITIQSPTSRAVIRADSCYRDRGHGSHLPWLAGGKSRASIGVGVRGARAGTRAKATLFSD